MNDRLKELALKAFQPINDMSTEGVADRWTFEQPWFQLYNEKFAEAVVFRIMERLDAEIELAFDQNEVYAASTLQALALSILDEFDMELPVEDDWDEEVELQKIVDEFNMNGDDQFNQGSGI